MRQALMHVMGNAVKFTTPCDVVVIEVKFTLRDHADAVELEIHDNGGDYNPAMRPKLFTVFGKLHRAVQFEGLGMWLALTHKILQRVGGVVDA
jgi:K+-sensing histidine kinase KdpD